MNRSQCYYNETIQKNISANRTKHEIFLAMAMISSKTENCKIMNMLGMQEGVCVVNLLKIKLCFIIFSLKLDFSYRIKKSWQSKIIREQKSIKPKLQCKSANRDSCYSWTCLFSLITRPVMHPRASSPNPREVYPLVIQQLTYHLSVCVRYLQFTAFQCRSRAIFLYNGLWLERKPTPYARKLPITFIFSIPGASSSFQRFNYKQRRMNKSNY